MATLKIESQCVSERFCLSSNTSTVLLHRLVRVLLAIFVLWTLCEYFPFSSAYAIPWSLAPSLHCLISTTSGPHTSLQYVEVMFGMFDYVGKMQTFRQTALFMRVSHLFYFFFSTLGAQGCYFDFYDVGLQCGSMFSPFALIDGLYLDEFFAVSVDSFISPSLLLISVLFLLPCCSDMINHFFAVCASCASSSKRTFCIPGDVMSA